VRAEKLPHKRFLPDETHFRALYDVKAGGKKRTEGVTKILPDLEVMKWRGE